MIDAVHLRPSLCVPNSEPTPHALLGVICCCCTVCGLAQTGNKIGDAGAAALAPALGRLVQLQALHLNGKSRLPLRFNIPRSSKERV